VKLCKALYGLIQSSMLWFNNISDTLINMGFVAANNDPCSFRKDFAIGTYIIGLHVDDLVHASPHVTLSNEIASQLTLRYGSMEHNFGTNLSFLSMNIVYDKVNGVLTIDQDAYMTKFLESLGEKHEIKLQQYPTIDNLMFDQVAEEDSMALDKEKSSLYRTYLMVLMYCSLRVRADIQFVIVFLASYMQKPTVNAWESLMKVIGYLLQNSSMKMTYNRSENCEYGSGETGRIESYIDASWCLDKNARGQSGLVLKIDENSCKQKVVTKSSTEAEIVAVDDYLPYSLWVLALSEELNLKVKRPIIVYQDNQSGVRIMEKGHGNFKRTKHFINKYYWIKQFVDDGSIIFNYIPTTSMIADIFTKPMTGHMFYLFIYFIINNHQIRKSIKIEEKLINY
jgi:hypothetical protein